MAKIPDRFLGFSFSVGDILIETDNNFDIKHADGAISDLGINAKDINTINFTELLSPEDKHTFTQLCSSLKPANRIGPVNFWLSTKNKKKKKYATFMSKLADDDTRIFIVLIASIRLGQNIETGDNHFNEETGKPLQEKIENILLENKGQQKKLNITLMETDMSQQQSSKDLDQLERLLNKYSVGGNTAGQLGNNKYAIVHAKEPDGLDTKDLLLELTKSTGISLNSTSIDADSKALSEEDGIRALIFSLQQFAEDSEGFDVDSLAKGYDKIVENTAEKVKHLRHILDKGEFSLVYQPIVSLKNNKVHHSEALIRFNDPELHDLQFETICFAEKVGLIQDFDRATFIRTVEKINQMKQTGTPSKLAVNMSGRSLSQKGFLIDLKKRLKEHQHLNKFISLEITESAEITNIERLATVIDEIRSMGFRVYLDDFGAGAAGFRYLRELTVDGVKIDGEYVRDALVDKKIRAFLNAIVMLCNDLEIETIAEWVETEEQAELLKSINVTYAQGYLYGRPNVGIKSAS